MNRRERRALAKNGTPVVPEKAKVAPKSPSIPVPLVPFENEWNNPDVSRFEPITEMYEGIMCLRLGEFILPSVFGPGGEFVGDLDKYVPKFVPRDPGYFRPFEQKEFVIQEKYAERMKVAEDLEFTLVGKGGRPVKTDKQPAITLESNVPMDIAPTKITPPPVKAGVCAKVVKDQSKPVKDKKPAAKVVGEKKTDEVTCVPAKVSVDTAATALLVKVLTDVKVPSDLPPVKDAVVLKAPVAELPIPPTPGKQDKKLLPSKDPKAVKTEPKANVTPAKSKAPAKEPKASVTGGKSEKKGGGKTPTPSGTKPGANKTPPPAIPPAGGPVKTVDKDGEKAALTKAEPATLKPKPSYSKGWQSVMRDQVVRIPTEKGDCKQFSSLCNEMNVPFYEDKYKEASSVVQHELDGLVIRPTARTWAMAAMYAATQSITSKTNQKWCDLYGAHRNKDIVQRVNNGCKTGSVELITHVQNNVVKDILRHVNVADSVDDVKKASMKNTWKCDSPMPLLKSNFDAVLIEDVQHVGVSDKSTILGIASQGLVVGLIFHLQNGEMGTQGTQGLWYRDGKTVTAYAHQGDMPYTDTVDMKWMFKTNVEIYNGVNISWIIEHVRGNVFYATVIPMKSGEKIKKVSSNLPTAEIEFETLNFSLTQDRRTFMKVLRSLFHISDLRTVLVNKKIASALVPKNGSKSLIGMNDKYLIEQVLTAFKYDNAMKILSTIDEAKYDALVSHTALYFVIEHKIFSIPISMGLRQGPWKEKQSRNGHVM